MNEGMTVFILDEERLSGLCMSLQEMRIEPIFTLTGQECNREKHSQRKYQIHKIGPYGDGTYTSRRFADTRVVENFSPHDTDLWFLPNELREEDELLFGRSRSHGGEYPLAYVIPLLTRVLIPARQEGYNCILVRPGSHASLEFAQTQVRMLGDNTRMIHPGGKQIVVPTVRGFLSGIE